MFQIKLLIILSTCLSSVLSFIESKSDGISGNILVNPTESYIGPDSYSTSFPPNNHHEFPSFSSSHHDYPSFGNYGYMMNMKNPQISSSYTSFGPSEGSEFGSMSYINYPQSTTYEHFAPQHNSGSYSAVISHDSSSSHDPSSIASIIANLGSNNNHEEAISQHIEVTKPVVVPVYKKFPYPVAKHFPVAVPHPVLVPVPSPYPVNVLVSEPVAVPVFREIRVPVEKEVMYPVEKNVPVEVEKPIQFHVEKHYPVYVPRPYPVKIPIIKTIIHKAPKKWSREQEQELKRSMKYFKSKFESKRRQSHRHKKE